MLNIAVLVSGGGTNLQALLDSEARGENPNGRIRLVVASKPGVYALERAANAGVEGVVVRRKDYASSEDFDAALLKCPLPFYRFHFIRQSFPSVTETVIKKGEAAFLLLSYYVMLSYFHPVSFFSFCRFIPLFEVQLCDSSSPLPDVSSPRHFPVLFP